MVVIGILAILSAISIPLMAKWKASHEYTGALRDVLLMFRQARTIAVEENETVMVSVNAATGAWRAFVDDGGGDTTDAFGLYPDGTFDEDDPQPDGVPDMAQNRAWDAGERIINSGTVPDSVAIVGCKMNGVAQTKVRLSFDVRGFPVNSAGNLVGATVTLSNDSGGESNIRLYQSGHSVIN